MVTLNLKVISPSTVSGPVVGTGNVPKSQTIEPLAPMAGLYVILLGDGAGLKNTCLATLPAT